MINKEESIDSGNRHSPFTNIGGWYSSNDNYSQISKGIVIEQKVVDIDRIYVEGVLSVTIDGSKCASSEEYVKV